MPWLRLTVTAMLALLLAGTHWKAYVSGQQAVRAQYVAAQLQAEKAARLREQQLIEEKQKAEAAYVDQKRKAAVAVSGARTELERLRDALAASSASEQTPASPRAADRAGLEQHLLGQCAASLVGMAAEADRLETLVVGLQGYIKNVCLEK